MNITVSQGMRLTFVAVLAIGLAACGHGIGDVDEATQDAGAVHQSAGAAGATCPGWPVYAGSAPCLVEYYDTIRADHYCEASDTDPCAAILIYYIDNGRCIGMERIVGESISSCTHY